ncbi:MAG: SBBP repeat-containing protein [Methanomicrobiales archaeon]
MNHNVYGFQLVSYNTSKMLIIDPTLQYSSYVGGSSDDYADILTITGLDAAGNIYITGYTRSANYPSTTGAYQTTLAGNYDAFITKIAPKSQGSNDLLYSTYIGGSSMEYGRDIAVDSAGNIYITGYTHSTNYPTTIGAYQTSMAGGSDAFISKLAPNSQGTNDLIYSTYIGGGNFELGWDIVVDDTGNIYITGETYSSNYPTTIGAYQTSKAGYIDAFVTIIAPRSQGSNDLLYSTYIGGSSTYTGSLANNRSHSLDIDALGNVYITGYTDASNYPTTPGAYQTIKAGTTDTDSIISKIAPNGLGNSDLLYSTYIGGTNADRAHAITLDNIGNVYITGYTYSASHPITSGAYQTTHAGYTDGFLSKLALNSQGSNDLLYSTFIGGNSYDYTMGVVVDAAGIVHLAGHTESTNYPTTTGAYQTSNLGYYDALLSILSPKNQGTNDLLYSTYIGGSGDDRGYGINVDNAGNSYINGYTYSTNYPTTTGAYQTSNLGYYDAFISKFGSAADLSICKSVDDKTPIIEDTIIYTVNVQNKGPDTSFGVIVQDILPAGIQYQSSHASHGTYDPLTGIWSIYYLLNGETATLTINCTVNNDGSITNTAKVSATTYDPVISDTTSSVTLNVTPKSSLYLRITGKTDPTVGDTVTYTLKVGNNGPSTAKDVVMTYTIPEGLEFLGATVDVGTWTYNPATRMLSWNLGDVPVCDPYMGLYLKIMKAGQYLINPQLFTSTYDPTLDENTQSLTVDATLPPTPTPVHSKTVGMQTTGVPVAALILAVLMVLSGIVSTKK